VNDNVIKTEQKWKIRSYERISEPNCERSLSNVIHSKHRKTGIDIASMLLMDMQAGHLSCKAGQGAENAVRLRHFSGLA